MPSGKRQVKKSSTIGTQPARKRTIGGAITRKVADTTTGQLFMDLPRNTCLTLTYSTSTGQTRSSFSHLPAGRVTLSWDGQSEKERPAIYSWIYPTDGT